MHTDFVLLQDFYLFVAFSLLHMKKHDGGGEVSYISVHRQGREVKKKIKYTADKAILVRKTQFERIERGMEKRQEEEESLFDFRFFLFYSKLNFNVGVHHIGRKKKKKKCTRIRRELTHLDE